MPPELTGLYSDANTLQRHVDAYLKKLADVEEGKRKFKRNKRLKNYEKKSKLEKFYKRLEKHASSITS